MFPRTLTQRLLLGGAAVLVILAAVVLIVSPDGEPGATTPVATSAPTTPASTTPAELIPRAAVSFPTRCKAVKDSRPLGLGLARPSRLASSPVEQAVFANAFKCLQAIAGRPPVLRTQLPIDVTRRRDGPQGFEYAELTSFAYLLKTTGASGIVSIRSHDFTRCPKRGDGQPRSRATLEPGEALQTCEYPSVPLYETLFTELHEAMTALAPGAQLSFSAWNEPDHPMFTLQPAYGQRVAARRAGKYWSVVAGIVGAERALAGEFSDQELPTLLSLREAFVDGTGGLTPAVWALHPYRDLTSGNADIETGFASAVAPSPAWVTEATPRISGKGGLSGRPTGQRRRGIALRERLADASTPLILYLLIPPPPPTTDEDDGWDSAIADRSGTARPFVCGLADLPEEQCLGDPEAFGG